ncbi:hypothetical protein WJX72_010852 [[Myrmecia] bisecta]|uniref:Transcription initiation factor TFIID subunit 1 n=1 Tax=[Myrmecia] bisecta TaxID=41462 RepID=A0AAW1QGU6_9CHLO
MSSDGEDEDNRGTMRNFLFGNVNQDGELEDDYLDEDAKESLAALEDEQLGLSVDGIQDLQKSRGKGNSPSEGQQAKAKDAASYSDEEELAADEDPHPAPRPAPVKTTLPAGLLQAAHAAAAAGRRQQAAAPTQQPAAQRSAGPRMSSAVAAQLAKAKAAGIDLPVLATDGRGALLRFSELFGAQLTASSTLEGTDDALAASKPVLRPVRAPRAEANKGEDVVLDDVDDEEQALHLQGAGVVGLMSADEEGEHGSEAEEEEEEEGEEEAQAAPQQPEPQQAQREEQHAALAQRRRTKRVRGGEPFVPGPASLDQEGGFAAVPDASFEAAHQQEWEAGILWESDKEAGQDAEAAPESEATGNDPGQIGPLALVAPANASMPPAAPRPPRFAPPGQLGPLPATTAGEGSHKAAVRLHPQQLRLDAPSPSAAPASGADPTAMEVDGQPSPPDTQALAVPDGEAQVAAAARSVPPRSPLPQVLREYNRWLVGDQWLSEVVWDGRESLAGYRPRLLLDMNDPRMVFEMMRGHDKAPWDNAPATVRPALPKITPVLAQLQTGRQGEAEALLARYNVSKDHLYSQKSRRKEKGLQASFCKHALPASTFSTLPVKHTNKPEMAHRPVGYWTPLQLQTKPAEQGGLVPVKLSSLVCAQNSPLSQTFKDVNLQQTTGGQLWEQAKAGKFGKVGDEKVTLYQRGAIPRKIKPTAPLGGPNTTPELPFEVAAVFTQLKPLPSSLANTVPDPSSGMPNKPPGAFAKKKDLTARDGHIVLLEYVEEHPLLLARPGMGVRLTTFYRKRSPTDAGHQKLANPEEAWRVGHIDPLQPDDDPPFLGDIKPGAAQLAVEANMFRSAAFPYPPAHTDFLVVRNAAGALAVRELTGTLIVGQQEPHIRVPAPHSKDAKELEERRLVALVTRELRNRMAKWDKRRKGQPPGVSVQDLLDLFKGLTDAVVRRCLRDKCECEPRGDGDEEEDTYVLRLGAQPPVEGELRKMITPDQWCAYESKILSQIRTSAMGCREPDRINALPMDKFKLAAEQLPQDPTMAKAVAALELAARGTSWTLTDNFISCIMEQRGALALQGPGDPSGRGRGVSFMKEARKPMEEAKPAGLQKREVGSIMGTAADLRRLSMDKAREALKKFGLQDEQLEGLTRWNLIALVRNFSSAAAADDSEIGKQFGSKYARATRMSQVELQLLRQRTCQQIFDRQAAALGSVGEDDTEEEDEEEDNFGDELENLLAEDEDKPDAKAKKATMPTDEAEEEALMREMREEGLTSGAAAEAGPSRPKGPKPKLEAAAGDRRVRRTITYTQEGGATATREVIYTNRDQIFTLNSMFARDGKEGTAAMGWGSRTIKGGASRKGGASAAQQAGGKARKAGKPKLGTRVCTSCGGVGHNKNSRNCPNSSNYQPPTARQGREPGSDEEEEDPEALFKPLPSKSRGGAKRRQSTEGGAGGSKRQRAEGGEEAPRLAKARSLKAANTGRKALNRLLAKILADVKKASPANEIQAFKLAVDKRQAPDYNTWVATGDEMHLDRIASKLRNNKYASRQEFLNDCHQILKNATAYNTPGAGAHGYPALIGHAQALWQRCQEEVVVMDAELAEAEALVRQEAAGGPGEGGAGGEGGPLPVQEAPTHWLECNSCGRWRITTAEVVAAFENKNWYCSDNFTRPGASCDDPPDPGSDAQDGGEQLPDPMAVEGGEGMNADGQMDGDGSALPAM